MSSAIIDAQREIAEGHQRISQSAAELQNLMADRVNRARQTVDPRHYARQYPWAMLGLAIGVGLAIGMTGADRKAAEGIADVGRKAGGAIGDGAASAKDAIVERFQGSDEGVQAEMIQPEPPSRLDEVRAQFASSVDGMLYGGLQEILTRLNIDKRSLRT